MELWLPHSDGGWAEACVQEASQVPLVAACEDAVVMLAHPSPNFAREVVNLECLLIQKPESLFFYCKTVQIGLGYLDTTFTCVAKKVLSVVS